MGVPLELCVPSVASARMRRQPERDTGPELALRSELFSRGHRYRVASPVPGLPRRSIDVAFTQRRLAVLVDGCFWHSCPEHATTSKTNAEWWAAKLQRNVERDRETDAALIAAGWRVVRVWEHEDPAAAVARIEQELNR